MTSEIPVTQAREELADLINRVAYGHERIVLTRHSKAVACLVPPEDLERLQGEGQEPRGLIHPAPVPQAPAPQPGAPGFTQVAAQYREPGQPRA